MITMGTMEESENRFKLGISSWTFPWAVGAASGPQPAEKMTAVQLLGKARELGISLVQIADNLPLEKLSNQELRDLKSFSDKNNIKIEVGTKGLDPDHLYKMLDIALFLESPVLRTLPALFGRRADMHEVEQNIRMVLPQFEKAGVIIVLENTEAFFAAEYAALMDRVNHNNFRMCVDLANAIGKLEGPHYVMDKLGKYCANYHFKDVRVIRSPSVMGFSVEGTSSGKGGMPIDYAIKVLKSLGLYVSVIIELWPPLLQSIEDTLNSEQLMATESVLFLKKYFNDN